VYFGQTPSRHGTLKRRSLDDVIVVLTYIA